MNDGRNLINFLWLSLQTMSSANSSLRPGWNRSSGRGFQPPPAVASERNRSQSIGSERSSNSNKFAALDDDIDEAVQPHSPQGPGRSLAALAARVPEKRRKETKVTRFTRERLLSMRPPPRSKPPEVMESLASSVVYSAEPLDPVCFDNLDAEAIWATVPRRAAKSEAPVRAGTRREPSKPGRWERGVALPPPDKKQSAKDSNDPNELWDDPVSGGGAANDFSAFAVAENDELAAFDFEKMAAASAKLEEEIHGSSSRSMGSSDAHDDENAPSSHKVDATRPLASAGMTIQSGSGDNVNVFEDFDDPGEQEDPSIKAADEDPSASSRLMAMIGVKKEEESKPTDAWGNSDPIKLDKAPVGGLGLPLNPWGGTLLPGQNEPPRPIDLQAEIRAVEEQKAREAELRLRREEEQQRLARQQAGGQSQVELVLVERISSILENSWGKSDLVSILSTLHAEDSRVIPLLNSVDALRALIMRNPQRILIHRDPSFGADMAVLQMTNAQWQQQQQAQARAQQAEIQRKEQQRQLEEQRKIQGNVVLSAPWYYSDPQGNIQGPFRSEEMRQWLEAGYFKGDLPISQQPNGSFVPLSRIFPDLSFAFVPSGLSSAQSEMEKKIEEERKHAEAKAREVAERERLQREATEKAERDRQAAERAERERQARKRAVVSADSNGGNESSEQLKMMLGLSSQQPLNVGASKQAMMSTASQKPDENNARPQAEVKREHAQGLAKPVTPAWGGAAQSGPKKSMSEIQKEEARAAAVAAMNRETSRSSSAGWANVAASRGGSVGWSGGATTTPPAVVSNQVAIAPSQVRAKPQTAASVRAAGKSQSQRQQPSSTAEEFGAQMSPTLEKWCKEQMLKLNGTDDLTLVSFCMSLNDPVEIRQYLTAYLGTTPAVNNFASEFINRKGGNQTQQQEEWETTSINKKKGKKKAVAR